MAISIEKKKENRSRNDDFDRSTAGRTDEPRTPRPTKAKKKKSK